MTTHTRRSHKKSGYKPLRTRSQTATTYGPAEARPFSMACRLTLQANMFGVLGPITPQRQYLVRKATTGSTQPLGHGSLNVQAHLAPKPDTAIRHSPRSHPQPCRIRPRPIEHDRLIETLVYRSQSSSSPSHRGSFVSCCCAFAPRVNRSHASVAGASGPGATGSPTSTHS